MSLLNHQADDSSTDGRLPNGKRLPNVYGAVCAEFIISAIVVVLLTPHILATQILEDGYSRLLYRWGSINGNDDLVVRNFWYWVCISIGVPLAAMYWWRRISDTSRIPATRSFLADAIALFATLTLLESVIASESHSAFRPYSLIYPIDAFFGAMLFLDEGRCRRIWTLGVCAASIQSVYAITYYCLGIHQFHTPGFGNRTQGTFDSPNALYPVCTMCAPVAFVLWTSARTRFDVVAFFVLAVLCCTAEILTFSRAAWLALASSIVALSYMDNRLPTTTKRLSRWLALGVAAILVVTVVVVRTGGQPMANKKDRSAWGRIAIWQTAIGIFAQHPVFGTAPGSYAEEQSLHYNSALVKYNARNIDAKSIYLNVLVEQGVAGLVCLISIVGILICTGRMRLIASERASRSLDAGALAALCGIGVAGFTDTPVLGTSVAAGSMLFYMLLGYLACRSFQTIASDMSDAPLPNRHC
jgi:O-antigen ligase